MTISSDGQLLSAFAAGDASAFATLVQTHQAALLRHARAVLGSWSSYEDVVQETFLKLAQKPPTLSRDVLGDAALERAQLSSWLHTVTRNLCMDVARSETRRKLREQEASNSEVAEGDLAVLDEADTRSVVEKQLNRLPSEQREVLVLRLLGERSYKEIAEITGKEDRDGRLARERGAENAFAGTSTDPGRRISRRQRTNEHGAWFGSRKSVMNQSNEERLQQLLCAYVLGEATESEKREVETALEGSEELRAEKARLESTIALVSGVYDGEEKLSNASLEALNLAASGGGKILYGPWYRKMSVRLAAASLLIFGAIAATQLAGSNSESKRADQVAMYELERRDMPTSTALDAKDELAGKRAGKRTQGASLKRRIYEDPSGAQKVMEIPGSEDIREWKQHLAAPEEVSQTETIRDEAGRIGLLVKTPASKEASRLADPENEPTVGAVVHRAAPTAGGSYKGPGNTVPPGTESTRASLSTGSKQANRLEKSKERKRGAPVTPGAAGPSSPGPVSSSPPVKAPKRTLPGLASEFTGGETLEQLGYVSGSDDFFLDSIAADESNDLGAVDEDDDVEDLARNKRAGLAGLGYFDDGRESRVAIRRLTPDEITSVANERCELIVRSCLPRPDESPRDMFYRYYGDNPFTMASVDKLSTFAADVDTSSYVLVRNYLKNRHLPTKAQIRTEEFLNYFRPDVEAPTEGVFRIATELAPSRFSGQPGRWMLRVAVRGRDVSREERKPLNLTFVTDTSGSMREQNRMELVKHALRLLLTELDARDSISIIGFSNEARLVLPMTSATNRGVIESAIYGLQPDGGTNPEAGLTMGYEVAALNLSQHSHSRVVLLSDGVGNIGETDQNRLTESVRHQRERGIYLNTIGVGMNNHNDEFLEQLANKGDGLSNYIDDELEARRALVENFTGAFEPIARDVKIQVEFDSNQVYRYRQLGYENRAVADNDFRNDKVDAGEIGAGHQVVCLYELELDPSFNSDDAGPLATVRVRYKEPNGAGRHPAEDSATEISHVVKSGSGVSFEGSTAGYRRSVLAAQFAEILRRSEHARGDSIIDLISASAKLAPEIRDPDFQEMLDLMTICRTEILKRHERRSDLGDCVDGLRRHYLRKAEFEALGSELDQTTTEDLEKIGRDLEEQVRNVIRRRIEMEQKKLNRVR